MVLKAYACSVIMGTIANSDLWTRQKEVISAVGFYVPERVIRLLCGGAALEQGTVYYEADKVTLTYAENNVELEYSKYRAEVQGLESYEVVLAIDSDGDVNGECTCPAYHHGGAFASISQLFS